MSKQSHSRGLVRNPSILGVNVFKGLSLIYLRFKKICFIASHFHSIYCSLREWYNQYPKHLQVSVLVLSIIIIIYLLGLSVLHSCILIFIITIMLGVLPFISVNHIPFLDTLGLFIIIVIYTLTDSVMTAELHTNFPNLSNIHIFLIHLGIARIIIKIIFTKNEGSIFDRLKTIVKKY